jgi:prevent-host-death family protein
MALVPSGHTVGAADAKASFSELLEQVEAGTEITITRQGTPIAKLIPIDKQKPISDGQQAVNNIRELRQRLRLDGLRVRDLINEGRR